MNEQLIDAIIITLRSQGKITALEKDILDTHEELHKQPLDYASAFRQMKSNELAHPDVLAKVTALPTTGQKPAKDLTEQDLRYVLSRQLLFLIEKETQKSDYR